MATFDHSHKKRKDVSYDYDLIKQRCSIKRRCNLYSVDIETDKICQRKKKKDLLDLEHQKQSLADTFEYRCS